MASQLRTFTLVRSLRVSTDGSTGAAGVYSFIELPVSADLMAAIFSAEWISTVGVLSEGPLDNELEVGLQLVSGTTREQELATPVDLLGVLNANNVPLRTAPYTTTTNFLPHSRLRVRVKNKNTVSGVRTGVVSFWLLVKAWG